ncbi:MAG: D-alanyl-D-alanine carboxypeptidase/D-alanyl-D-alanine-endopeptidase [Epsilonproteobacteria bacterium]|nr:D-alanyl-D-alanine carboxypeptidase/D-alanyl-D-alanine-endopeptidase [Campylobacterota bacterium]
MKYLVALVLFFNIAIWGDGYIPFELDNKIQPIPLNPNSYSIYIQDIHSSREPIASWNIHKKRTPASVIKLLTIYAGVLGLGYDYRWETKFYYTGYIRKGVLRGDLIVKASGDPTLKTEDLDEIVNHIRSLGVRKILGNIVIDRTLFQVSNRNSSRFDKNIYSPYNAMPDALMFNERKSTLCVTTSGRAIKIKRDIPDWSYKVVNKIRPVNGSCRRGRSWPKVSIKERGSQSIITFSGRLAKRCGDRKICKVVTQPYKSFYYALKAKMKANGISFRGKLKLHRVPQKAKYIFSHYSPTLEEVISIIAKESNNLMARQLMLTLGSKLFTPPSNTMKGRKAIERILNRYNILEPNSTYISNGSGLSRVSTVTAKTLANLLRHAAISYGDRWMSVLSIAGIDGTIKRRFHYSTVYGRAWMKTGTIRGVANIAGYVEGISGKRYVVVVLVNDKYSARYGRKLANIVIEWVADNL